jgi:hypothetical protein
MQEMQLDRAERAMAESARLVAQSNDLRKNIAETLVKTSRLMASLVQATPKHLLRPKKPLRNRTVSSSIGGEAPEAAALIARASSVP